MLGAIIGDIVGSRFEFNNIKTKEFTLITKESKFTDDSVLTIAVMDILLSKDLSNDNIVNTIIKWVKKYPYAGYGNRFINWVYHDAEHKPYNSCGNGSAMKISPVAYVAKNIEEVIELSDKITKVTHNHPEGMKGARVCAVCVYMALHNEPKEKIKEYILEQYPEVNDPNYQELVRSYYHGLETCQASMPQALYCFLISNSFEDCLRTTISIGGDCDTTAAISCAIAEAYYKHIDTLLLDQIKNKLTPEMLKIVDLFGKEYNN